MRFAGLVVVLGAAARGVCGAAPRRRVAAVAPRQVLRALGCAALALTLDASIVSAKPDCFKDCSSNCARVYPGNGAYCTIECDDYCAQPDRRDGLSGSVSSEGGYVGLASPLRGGDTVEYGADAPPKLDALLPESLRQALAPAKPPAADAR
ncbi:hypothetical protein M885DRAFT_504959 [Pelagophyceae sp. CCMP2097]|nr:hypothetical protein M885DRAFT_504959 [Pelagophyceae sp. CCMP2097]